MAGAMSVRSSAQTSPRIRAGAAIHSSSLASLKAWWGAHQGGVIPFLLYHVTEGTYDATGNSTQGATQSSSAATGPKAPTCFVQTPQIELGEVATSQRIPARTSLSAGVG